jgi:adenylylsulfate kinase
MAYSLLIGRWQPLHAGHKKLIQSVLDEGKQVCVAIRETEVSPENPYTVGERREMIRQAFPQVMIIVIPNISEVVFGRRVGYGIREIALDKATEAISGTEIRKHTKAC